MISGTDIQNIIDQATSGQKVIIYNPDREDLGTLNVGEEITIEYDYTPVL
jgi:hypothetical protein